MSVKPLSIAVPTQIETERLVLRAFREDDALAFHEAIEPALPTLRKWITSTVQENTIENQKARIAKAHKDWIDGTRYNYLTLDKETGAIVGLVGVFNVNWDNRYGSLGYWVVPQFEGRGLATEAAKRLLALAKDDMQLDRIALMCDVRNAGSARVAAKLGFHYEGTLRREYRGPDGALTDTKVFSAVRGVEY
ncbi:acyl-CoA N-acyltransferase [Obelidium mucronatum]|nr:acyl-CoA N-acyltransferase [Obelidium mucronatum]